MHLPISSRLLACAALVAPGDRIADIGCDHGYLSIYLLQKGIACSAIAADVNEGPLQSARRNSEKYGVAHKMSFHLSDGVCNVPRDFDTLICAGMGADTMISILSNAPWLQNQQYRLILQCQSKTPSLRQYLSQQGWQIVREAILRDGRFLYTVMEVLWQPDAPRLTPQQWYFPPVLLNNPKPELEEYHQRLVNRLRISVTGHAEQANSAEVEALKYLESIVF